jgi:hypothetical protein
MSPSEIKKQGGDLPTKVETVHAVTETSDGNYILRGMAISQPVCTDR